MNEPSRHFSRLGHSDDQESTSREGGRRRWADTYAELQRFARSTGRMPSKGEVPERLLSWIKNQRRRFAQLSTEKRAALDLLAGWSVDPREDWWEDRLEELRRFVQEQHRLPRVRAAGADERGLAHWLSRQRRASAQGWLAYQREIALRPLLVHAEPATRDQSQG